MGVVGLGIVTFFPSFPLFDDGNGFLLEGEERTRFFLLALVGSPKSDLLRTGSWYFILKASHYILFVF